MRYFIFTIAIYLLLMFDVHAQTNNKTTGVLAVSHGAPTWYTFNGSDSVNLSISSHRTFTFPSIEDFSYRDLKTVKESKRASIINILYDEEGKEAALLYDDDELFIQHGYWITRYKWNILVKTFEEIESIYFQEESD